jgi:hypothetical protein
MMDLKAASPNFKRRESAKYYELHKANRAAHGKNRKAQHITTRRYGDLMVEVSSYKMSIRRERSEMAEHNIAAGGWGGLKSVSYRDPAAFIRILAPPML